MKNDQQMNSGVGYRFRNQRHPRLGPCQLRLGPCQLRLGLCQLRLGLCHLRLGLSSRRLTGFVSCGLLLLAFASVAYAQSQPQPKNIVLIMADDVGIECFGCYGGEDYQTPRIDALAASGLRFSHAYSQPLCTPTRLEIMTGRENHRNWMYFGILPPQEKTFGHMMQQFGYETCIAGKWQLQSYDPPDFPNADRRRGKGMHPRDAGFSEYSLFHALHTEDKGSRYANPTFLRNGKLHTVDGAYGEDLSVEFILDFMSRNKAKPMFVYYPMALPHWPMVPTPISKAWQDPEQRLDESTAYFPDMVEYMDELVGRLVDGIEKLGLREDTLVLFYSDNGTDRRITSTFAGREVQGGKNTTAQTGIRVPLIANWPGKIKPRVTRDLVEAADFVPTLAELAGKSVPEPWQIDGFSFAPTLFRSDLSAARDWAFFWYDPRPGWDKDKFSRSIFALDHNYKLFGDGRMYDIAGTNLREQPIDVNSLTPKQTAAREQLQRVIDKMMTGAMSVGASVEVNAFGDPIPGN